MTMKCVCGGDIIWGGDHTFEDYCVEGDGIVSNGSCSKCPNYVLLYCPLEDDGEQNVGTAEVKGSN